MAQVNEIVKAASYSEAVEVISSLYPTMTNFELISRRDSTGRFSKHGHSFIFSVTFEEPEEEAPKELGEEEY